MKRLLALTTFGIWFFLCTTGGAFNSAIEASVTGPLAQRLSGKPPAISVGGKSADEIKAKIKSGQIKRLIPPGRLHHNSSPADDLFEVLIVPSGGEAFVLDSDLQRVIVLEQAEGRAAKAAEVRVGMSFS